MATVASAPDTPFAGAGWTARAALARRALRDSRVRTVGFVYLFAAVSYLQPIAYRHAYPTLADRLGFAHSFADNKAVVLFYGKAYDLLTVGGYSAWRVGGTLAILAAAWGLLAAVRALRTEEDSGRAEFVLAGILGRGSAYAVPIAVIGVEMLLLWAATFFASVAGGLPAGGSAYLALAVASNVPVFVGVGALVSQLAPTRRVAIEMGAGVVALALVLRVIADTSGGAGWLRWATPLGWAELLRPFTGAQPVVLILPVVASASMLVAAGRIAARRDLGSGLLSTRDTASPRLGLLSSPVAQALRSERVSLLVWLSSVSAFAVIIGVISKSISSAGISRPLARRLAKLGEGSILTPKGYLGFCFIFFVLIVTLFACSQVAAARHEEAEERLETLLALPVARGRWLAGRMTLAAGAAVALALCSGVFAWAGAISQGVSLSLPRMLEAGANCLPVAVLFLGLGVLAYAAVPRAGVAVIYGLVTVAFLWQLFGGVLGAPAWLVHLTPFAHVGLVPAQAFQPGAAAVMVAIGAASAVAGIAAFERRDLTGA